MDFTQVVHKTWNQHLLFSVLIELTYRCNLNCFFCYNDLELEGEPLSLEQYFTLLEELAEMQVFNVVLTGGEPLAHPDFFAIGRRARDLRFMVRVKSNGHALGPAIARRLKQEVDPFLVEVSLHGADAETHDRQTRVPGSFERLLANLEHMVDAGLRVRINSTLTRWNEDQIEDMYAIAERSGLPMHIDPIVTARDDGDTSPLQVAPSTEGVARLIRLQHERSAQGETLAVGRQADDAMPAAPPSGSDKPTDKHCGAGSAGLAVDPYGDVYPCVQWRRSIGNLHQHSVTELWSGSRELQQIRQINRQVKDKIDGLGEYGQALNFCPGQAALESGSPLELYDSAERRAQTLSAVKKTASRLPIVR